MQSLTTAPWVLFAATGGVILLLVLAILRTVKYRRRDESEEKERNVKARAASNRDH